MKNKNYFGNIFSNSFFKRLLVFAFLISIGTSAFSQFDMDDKYWFYRHRLRYFVKPGLNQGESNVAATRNNYGNLSVSFAEQIYHLGWYISVLTTEYSLLNSQGEDVNDILVELYYAYQAYLRLDMCESTHPWYLQQDYFDGYCNRDEVVESDFQGFNPNYTPTPFLDQPGVEEYFNEGLADVQGIGPSMLTRGDPYGFPAMINSVTSDYCSDQEDDGDYDGDEMSHDCILYFLTGIALTKKLLPDYPLQFIDTETGITYSYNFNEMAVSIATILRSYYRELEYNRLLNPNGELIHLGGVPIAYLFAYEMAFHYIIGDDVVFPHGYLDYVIWDAAYAFHGSNGDDYNQGMMCNLAAIAEIAWLGSFNLILPSAPTIPFLNKQYHIDRLWVLSSINSWDSYYLLLYGVLHDYQYTLYNIEEEALGVLNSAPDCGPYFYYSIQDGTPIKPTDGWASSFKFQKSNRDQNEGIEHANGNYNGLDYMLLHNLYKIYTNQNISENLIEREMSDIYPYFTSVSTLNIVGSCLVPATFKAINTLESDSEITTLTIGNTVLEGDVTFTAGKSIRLKPGFEVSNDANFHAYIDKIDCSNSVSLTERNEFIENSKYDNNVDEQDEEENVGLLETSRIIIYPNPSVDGQFSLTFIDIESNSEVLMNVYDSQGNCILTDEFLYAGDKKVNLSKYNDGVYFINIQIEDKVFNEKLIKN